MILNITIENFRSYNEVQTLSLIASENNGINSSKIEDFEVRKSAVVYGANASGKSNIIKAVKILKTLLEQDLSSAFYQPFFDNKKPTKIILDFELNNKVYTYVIEFDDNSIYSEGLLDINKQYIFKRSVDEEETNKYLYNYFQVNFILNEEQLAVKDQVIKAWELTTTEKQLFLRRCAENGSKNLQEIKDYITNIVFKSNPYMTNGDTTSGKDLLFASNFHQSMPNQEPLIKTLNAIGAGFSRLEIIDQIVTMPDNQSGMVRRINSHYLHNGKDVVLNFADESDGTIKFYNYFAILKNIVETNGVIIIDELETHFHPLLVNEIINAIHTSDSKAQLIFTTHNPLLLNEGLFENDQIYFTSKDEDHATTLYSLVDFEDLKENDNISADYLTGNFGAIPYIDNIIFKKK